MPVVKADRELIVRARKHAAGLQLDKPGDDHHVFYRRLRIAWAMLELNEDGGVW